MFYVYEIRTADTGKVIYVGKGSRNRYKTKKKNDILNRYISENKCNYVIVAQYETEMEAFEAERQRISELKAIGEATYNKATESIGGLARVWTEERRARMSERNPMKDAAQRERMSKNNPMKNPDVAKTVGQKNNLVFEIDGKKYYGLKSAADEYGVTIQAVSYWLDKGTTRDGRLCRRLKEITENAPIKTIANNHTVMYDGREYPSIKEAAKAAGCARNTMQGWLRRGFSANGTPCKYKDDKTDYQYTNLKSVYSGVKRAVEVEGIQYDSIIAAAKATGISANNISYYLRHAKNPPVKCNYVNQQPSGVNFDNSNAEGSTTNG